MGARSVDAEIDNEGGRRESRLIKHWKPPVVFSGATATTPRYEPVMPPEKLLRVAAPGASVTLIDPAGCSTDSLKVGSLSVEFDTALFKIRCQGAEK